MKKLLFIETKRERMDCRALFPIENRFKIMLIAKGGISDPELKCASCRSSCLLLPYFYP